MDPAVSRYVVFNEASSYFAPQDVGIDNLSGDDKVKHVS